MLDKIIFKGYKSFKKRTELELKPITILIGKNSSGKSAVAKLVTLIEASLSGKFQEPFLYNNNDVELGAEFRDLFYNRRIQEQMFFELNNKENKLSIQITNPVSVPFITGWEVSSNIIANEKLTISSEEIEKVEKYPFSGFILNEYSEKIRDNFNLKVDYIGPFRINPPRVFHLNGMRNFDKLGNEGENAYQLLVQNEELVSKVSSWYQENFDGWELYVNEIEPYYEIKIRRKGSKDNGMNIVDVGQGMSQALPIVVKAHMDNSTPILNVFEQPELHLHPAAHGNLAELFVNSTIKTENKYLVETHSKNFILRLRRLIAEGKLDKKNINLYWVDYDDIESSSTMRRININDKGEVDFWPESIFNESFEEALALKKAQMK